MFNPGWMKALSGLAGLVLVGAGAMILVLDGDVGIGIAAIVVGAILVVDPLSSNLKP